APGAADGRLRLGRTRGPARGTETFALAWYPRRPAATDGGEPPSRAIRRRQAMGSRSGRVAIRTPAVHGRRTYRPGSIDEGHRPRAQRIAETPHVSVGSEGELRALQVIDTFGMGGAETWLMEVVRRLSSSGAAKIDFLATSGNVGFFDDEARHLG